MRFDFTISGPAGEVDIRVEAAAAPAIGALRAELAASAGLPEHAELYSDGRVVAEQALLGSASLRSGAELTTTPSSAGAATAYTLQVLSGPCAGAGHPLHRGEVSIGRSAGCDVVLADDRVSRRHASLTVGPGSLALRDHGSTNGTTIDGIAVPASGAVLRPGPVLRIGDSLLAVVAPAAAPASVVEQGDVVLIHRAARQRVAPAAATIDLPERAESPRPRPIQWIGALVPAAASGGIAWATGSALFLVFGLLSPVMLISTALGDRVHWRRSRRQAGVEFRRAQQRATAEIEAALAHEAARRRAALPDPPTVALIACTPGTRLWERRSGDDDSLTVRVGSAALPSAARVQTGSTARPAGMLRAVPVAVDLRSSALGIAGPAHLVEGLARWILAQLTTWHSPTDVEVALLLSPETADRWAWARWLPHLRRPAACTPGERAALLSELTAGTEHRRRARELLSRRPGCWTVLVVDTGADAADLTGLPTLASDATDLGLTGLYISHDRAHLPAACGVVLSVAGESGTRALIHGGDNHAVDAAIDTVSSAWAETLARALAPLADSGGAGEAQLPDECSLLDILGIPDLDTERVTRAWAASTGRPDAVLGLAGDGPVCIDLVSDGPHALIAGTTGAGKSQLLRTLVAGLALQHPPNELTVLLVDYKGGAAFAECAALPHCVGLVTDLDPHLTRRALRSLEAELRRRERLLNEAGAADLDGYRRARPDAPLPRLVIVVDEFATLADELPEFVPGLIGVAQRGRSLGIHLVLATQRPGSVVSPEIKANTSLRIALRVTDATESLGIIDAADAATIAASTPGRAYLRAGAELRCFQAARVITPAVRRPDVPTVVRLDAWRRAPREQSSGDEHGLADLVAALRRAARASRTGPAASPWLPALPALLTAAELGAPAGTVPFGLLDLPAVQAQPPLDLRLDASSSTLVVGGPRSGRTTALAAIALGAAAAWPVDDLEIHVVDPVGDLVGLIGALPHLGTCLGPGQDALVATLLERLGGGGLAPGTRRLLLLDSWETLRAGQHDADAARCQHLLAALLRSAPGVTTVVAGDRTLTSPRISGAFGSRLALRFADRSDYGALGIAIRDVPAQMPPGRGIRADDAAEFQIAVPGIDTTGDHDIDVDIAAALRRATATLHPPPSNRREPASRLRLRPLPRSLCIDDIALERRAAPASEAGDRAGVSAAARLRIGVGGDTATSVTLDPFAGARRWMVAGPPRSGRSSTLMTVLAEGLRLRLDVVVAAPPRSPLADIARTRGVRVLTPATGEPGPVPDGPTLLLVDDSETFLDTDVGELLLGWVRDVTASVPVLLAGRSDELAVAYRGLAAEIRRSRSGIALRPGPVDGELFGTGLPRAAPGDPPGRGYLIADQAWSTPGEDALPVPIQVALCSVARPDQPMCG